MQPDPALRGSSPSDPGTKESLRTVGRGTAGMLLGSAVTAITNFAIAVLVARSLPQVNAGIFFTGTALFVLLYGISRLAAGAGLVRFLAADRAADVRDRVSGLFRAALVPVLAFSILTALGLLIAAPWVFRTLLNVPAAEGAVLVVWASLIPFAAVSDVLVSATRGFDRYAPAVLVDKISRPIAQLLLTTIAAAAGADPLVLVALWALPYAASAVWSWLWIRRLRSNLGLLSEQSTKTPWREFWRFNWALSLGLWVQVILQRLDVILLSALRNPVEAAIYVAASRFFVLGQLIGTSFSLSLQPLIARYSTTGNTAMVRRLYATGTAWLVLTSWPLYLLMIIYAPAILEVFGEGYSEAADVLRILAAAMMVATAIGPVDQVLIMSGRPTWVLANSAVALAVNVGLNLWLIPPLGATGAAVAWAASILCANLVPLVQLVLWRRLHPFGRSLAWSIVVTLVSFALTPILVRGLVSTSPWSELLSVSLALMLFGAGLRLLRKPLQLSESPFSAILLALSRQRRGP